MAPSQALLVRLPVHGSYVTDLLPSFILVGVGMAVSFVAVTIAALQGVQPANAGIASGLVNTSRQIGGAIGLAAITTVATTFASHAAATESAAAADDTRLPGRVRSPDPARTRRCGTHTDDARAHGRSRRAGAGLRCPPGRRQHDAIRTQPFSTVASTTCCCRRAGSCSSARCWLGVARPAPSSTRTRASSSASGTSSSKRSARRSG